MYRLQVAAHGIEVAPGEQQLVNYEGHAVVENEFARAVVSPHAGASLRSIRVKKLGGELEMICGGDALTLDPHQLPHGTGSFIMAPWPNRIPGAELVAPDGRHLLETDGQPRTIHGLVRDLEWQVTSHATDAARFEVKLPDAWPWDGSVSYEIRLSGKSLVQTLTVESVEGEFPAGAGWHPWFRDSLGSDGVQIKLDAIETWVLDEQMTPTGETAQPPLLGQVRKGARLRPGTVDDCFRVTPGTTTTLSWPELTLEMSSSETVGHVMVYTPPDGSALCVEPQTCAVNAFQLHARGLPDTGTQLVAPRRPLTATTKWSWR